MALPLTTVLRAEVVNKGICYVYMHRKEQGYLEKLNKSHIQKQRVSNQKFALQFEPFSCNQGAICRLHTCSASEDRLCSEKAHL